MKFTDFKRDETAGYGIFDQLGMKYDDRLSLDVDEDDIVKKFEKLLRKDNKILIHYKIHQKLNQDIKTIISSSR